MVIFIENTTGKDRIFTFAGKGVKVTELLLVPMLEILTIDRF
jgi:hypothetical protein